MIVIILIIILALAFALQFVMGAFPVDFFAFPLNLICALIWLIVHLYLWKEQKKSAYVSHMLSPSATFSSIFLLFAVCMYMGFTADRGVAQSWVFLCILLYFQTVLFFVILRGWRAATPTGARLGPVRFRFVLLHAGLLLALSSAFWGAPDSDNLRLKLIVNQPTNEAVAMDASTRWLDYEFELKAFDVKYSANGMPSDYNAEISVSGETVSLRVNNPHSLGFGKQIYLSSYDTSSDNPQYCIIQYIYEPWKYAALCGIILMLIGAFLLFINGPKRRYNETD